MKLGKKTLLPVFVLGLALALLISGCSSSGSTSTGSGTTQKKRQIVIATGGSAGTYYAVGAGLAKIINKYSTDLNAVSQGTNGAVENVRLVNSGQADIGITNWDALYFGYSGENPFKGEKQNIVGLMTLYRSALQVAVLDSSPIKSIADLKGKKVNVGPTGSVAIEMTKALLRENGIDPDKDIKPVNLSYDEGGSKLVDGDLDATVYLAGVPTSGLLNISSTNKIRLLSLDEKVADSILSKYPYYDKVTIPAGTYKGIDSDTNTLQAWTALIVNPNMPEEVAYEIVKIILEHTDELQEVHEVLKDVSLENAARMPIPLHPGAKKYFEEHK